MKIEMSYEIKSTNQSAKQLVNHTNQLQTNLVQPAKQQTSEKNVPSKHLQAKKPEVEPTWDTN